MKIDRTDIIAGMPALEAREVIQKCVQFYNGFTTQDIAKKINTTNSKAKIYIQALEDEKFVKQHVSDKNQKKWIVTMAGCSLAQASAAKKIKRATADKHYALFLERINEINANDKYLYQVTKAAVFGSYLTDAPTVSDIDIFVWLERKLKFIKNFTEVKSKAAQEMEAEGRVFRSFGDQLHWPELDVRKYLKNGSRVISIQGHNDGSEVFNYKVVYDINQPNMG